MYDFELTADVVVLGIGTAGICAALAASDSGASVIAVEKFGASGGTGSIGLVTPLMHTHIPENPDCSYISREINTRLYDMGASDGDRKNYFDPIAQSALLDQMLIERKVRVLYHSFVTGCENSNGHIDGILVSNASGNGVIRANKRYIDCTGDACVCRAAGLKTLHGDEIEHKNQPCSLRYILSGIDTEAFWKYLCEMRGDPVTPRPENFDGAVSSAGLYDNSLKPLFKQAISEGLLSEDDMVYWQFFTVPFQNPRFAPPRA